MVALLDMPKEAALRICCLDAVASVAGRANCRGRPCEAAAAECLRP